MKRGSSGTCKCECDLDVLKFLNDEKEKSKF